MISQDGGLYFRNPATEGIYYQGTKANYRMIRFIDNTSDANGNGISIGGGGLTLIGSGESADTLISSLNLTTSGGTETLYVASDDSIEFYPGQQSYSAAARIWMTAGVLNIGVDGNTTRENSLNIYSGAGRVQLYSGAATSGNRGLWFAAHGTGSAKSVITVNTNNNVNISGNEMYTDKITAYGGAGFISSTAGSPWPYIRFDTRAGGSTYVTTAQTNWCELYAQVPAKRDSTYYKTRFFFRQYSKTANTTTRLNYYEDYYLPETNDGRTSSNGYNILTTKDMSFSITGNAATATKATQDGSGNTITSYYVTLSTDQTITGTKTFQKRIIAYGYKQATNLPFMTFDKPGSYATGIGPDGTNNRIHFGPCDLAGTAWTSTSAFNSNEWHFQGKITATSTVTATGFTGPLTGNVTGNCSGSSGSCTGNAATATTASTLAAYASIGSSTTDHGVALKNWFTSNKSTAPRNKVISFYSATSGNGSQYIGYFLSGYADNPYGGFFVCHYNNPYYVGISNGTYTQQHILTSTNYTSYTVTKTGSGASGSWGISVTGSSASCTGNAATATKLHTARAINGTNFDGSGAITTANWGTARNFTIKDYNSNNAGTAVSVNGSGAVTLLMPSTIYCSDVRSGNTRIVSDWIGFYQNANAGGKRYGYIECNVNRMYFRKENSSTQDHYFDFGAAMYVDGAIGCAGSITTNAALQTGSGITIRRDPSSGNCKIWFATNAAVNKWRIGVDGNDRFAISAYADGEGSYDFWVYNNGACYYKTSIGASSRYIKHNIHLLTMDTGNIIDRMEPVSFVFNNDQKETINLGFIYEDLVKILPEVCFHGEGEDNNLGINYTGIIPVLVKEIQSLRKRLTTVETELNSYKSKT